MAEVAEVQVVMRSVAIGTGENLSDRLQWRAEIDYGPLLPGKVRRETITAASWGALATAVNAAVCAAFGIPA